MEQAPIPGAQTYIPFPYVSLTDTPYLPFVYMSRLTIIPHGQSQPSSWRRLGMHDPWLLFRAQVGLGTEEEMLVDPKQLHIEQNVIGHFDPALAKCKI